MSEILTLPTQRIAATRVDPKILIIYGPPKIGKTTMVAELENNLILDCEMGTEFVDAIKVPITSIEGETTYEDDLKNPGQKRLTGTSVNAVIDSLIAQATAYYQKHGKKMKAPYKYITVDTIDKMEDYCEVSATRKYKESTIGKTFDGQSVLELPKGAGYYHLRNEVLLQIDRLSMVCEYLILVSHIKEILLNKGGIDVSLQDISLTGKLGSMVCAKADIVGYVYREPKKPLMISFETFNKNIMGARVPRLAGKRIPFEWKEIFSQEYAHTPAPEQKSL
jgi:hypothetical protein